MHRTEHTLNTTRSTPLGHVVLIGAMGVGKSTVGRRLADRLAVPFHDNDEDLLRATGRSAHDLAAQLGIERLHELELSVLVEAMQRPGRSVVTAAASVVDTDAGRRLLRSAAAVVWLRADPAIEQQRLDAAISNHRPDDAPVTHSKERARDRHASFAAAATLAVTTDGSIAKSIEDILHYLAR